MSATTTTNNEANERVFNLTRDLIQLQKNKKDSAAGFNEEIKRVKKEIDEVISEVIAAE